MNNPEWCPHSDCKILRCLQGKMCIGELSVYVPHNDGFNTHRFCLDERETEHGIHDLQINKTDAWWISRLLKEIY